MLPNDQPQVTYAHKQTRHSLYTYIYIHSIVLCSNPPVPEGSKVLLCFACYAFFCSPILKGNAIYFCLLGLPFVAFVCAAKKQKEQKQIEEPFAQGVVLSRLILFLQLLLLVTYATCLRSKLVGASRTFVNICHALQLKI